jgi:ribonuclease HI
MIIFTDGSTINNGKKNAIGGIGVFIPKQNEIEECNISYALQSTDKIKVTNQISELIAIIIGIEASIKITNETIYVYTDSKYSMDCATVWSKSWINNKWKKSNGKIIDNLWLVYRLVQLTKKHPIIFKHIKAHTDEPTNKNTELYQMWLGNNIVDGLAQSASRSIVNLDNSVKILNWKTFASLIIYGMKNDINNNIPYINDITLFYKKTFNFKCDVVDSDSISESVESDFGEEEIKSKKFVSVELNKNVTYQEI